MAAWLSKGWGPPLFSSNYFTLALASHAVVHLKIVSKRECTLRVKGTRNEPVNK